MTEPAVNVGQNIRIAIDAKLRRVHFDRWGVIEGAAPRRSSRYPNCSGRPHMMSWRQENYPFITSADLAHRTKCDNDETLRRRILHCRKQYHEAG